jgi:hypothetical protein
MDYVHKKNVLVDDIALRDYLLTDNLSLKMIDSGQCSLFPLDTDMATADDDGFTVRTDLFHLGCVIYSVSSRVRFACDLFDQDMKWSDMSEWPSLEGTFCERIIRRCWSGGSMDSQMLSNECSEWLRMQKRSHALSQR